MAYADFPDFYLVGAPKAATTSFYHYLGHHPRVFVPEIKEPHFFSCPEVKNTYYQVPLIEQEADYLALYAGAGQRLKGDFSTSYLRHPQAARRIHERRPDARIIIILRDPVDRAISHYLMDRRFGYQELPLAEFLEKTSHNAAYYSEYVEVGFYHQQVPAYLSTFGEANVRVYLYEEVRAQPRAILEDMQVFLGLDPCLDVELDKSRNEHRLFRSSWSKRLFDSRLGQWANRLSPQGLKTWVRDKITTTRRPHFSAERDALRRVFDPSVRALEKQLARDLSHWRSP
jgi:hypothetical protein